MSSTAVLIRREAPADRRAPQPYARREVLRDRRGLSGRRA